MLHAFGGAATALLTESAADPAVRAFVGQQLSGFVASALGGTPAAVDVGSAVSTAVLGLLADPAVTGGLAAVASARPLPVSLTQPGVIETLSGTAGQIATAVLSGATPAEALQAALGGQFAVRPAIKAAIGATIAIALSTADTRL